MELAAGDVDHDQCAADLAYGFNTMGLPEEMAAATPVLDRGGVVLQPCPDCERFEREHVLQVRRRDGVYEVTT